MLIKKISISALILAALVQATIAFAGDYPNLLKGQAAIDFLGDKIKDKAVRLGDTPEGLKNKLLMDKSLYLDKQSLELLFMDDISIILEQNKTTSGECLLTPTTCNQNENNLIHPDHAFLLHSNPGADRVIYLDFNGHTTSGTLYNRIVVISGEPIISPPYDIDGDPFSFNPTERQQIINIWQRVAEDFAPFNVDITTEDPGVEALKKTSADDVKYGVRTIITPTFPIPLIPGTNGMAFLGSFTSDVDTPSFVFSEPLQNNDKYIAEIISHETGHTIGLLHDGLAVLSGQYYRGHGNWAPIMGTSIYKPITQWSKGEYFRATNQQDDLAVMDSYIPFKTDDHPDFVSQNSIIPNNINIEKTNSSNINVAGLISNMNDVDVFTIWAGSGNLSITLNKPSLDISNLDSQLDIYKVNLSQGTLVETLIATQNLEGQVGESLSFDVPADSYYAIKVKGVGFGDPLITGYTNYGSLGVFELKGSYQTSKQPRPPLPTNESGGETQYSFSGFFQPVDNLPSINSIKAGSSVPIKFMLGGNQGLDVLTLGYPKVASIECDMDSGNVIQDNLEAANTNSNLSYDEQADQYVYVWKTEKSYAGSCKQFILKLKDGQTIFAHFKFNK